MGEPTRHHWWAFQLTRSRGAWLKDDIPFIYRNDFNSHAHVERDYRICYCQSNFRISTHTLTWSVTQGDLKLFTYGEFQLTRSRGAWQADHALMDKDFLFQLTRSRGAWLSAFTHIDKSLNFNSHAHVERDLHLTFSQNFMTVFQLTRSRGAWLNCLKCTHTFLKFQLTRSRGAWQDFDFTLNKLKDFNSHAHVERDCYRPIFISRFSEFQLTRSRGAWPRLSIVKCKFRKFQLTRSRGAWHNNPRRGF